MTPLHSWNLSPREAIALQNELRERLQIQPLDFTPKTVAGADISFDKNSETVWAGIVILSFPQLEIIEECGLETGAKFPYIPGLLSFRESPAYLEVWEKLRVKPDVLVLDGQGTAHPRGMGIACHLGLWLQIPTIGCAKTLLCGRFGELGENRGETAPLVYKKQQIGAALRTKNRVNPVFVSPGHLCDLESAKSLLLACDGGYKIPEPTRRAHLFVNRLRLGQGV